MSRLQVYISDEGGAEIDGVPLATEPGQSYDDAVLHQLQAYAQERAMKVTATVNDSADTIHFVLEVSPDGSSRLIDLTEQAAPELATPSSDAASEGLTAPATPAILSPAKSATADPVATAPDCVTEPVPMTPNVDSAIAFAVTRARVTAAAQPSGPAPVPAAVLPPEIVEQLARIHALESAGRLDEAFAGASALRERLTDSAGADHPYALEAQAVEAYLAHLCGNHREATVLALGVARMRCSAGHEGSPVDVARATAAWQRLEDERAILTHGRELLHMWDSLRDRGLLIPSYAELAGQVREMVGSLAAYA